MTKIHGEDVARLNRSEDKLRDILVEQQPESGFVLVHSSLQHGYVVLVHNFIPVRT